LNDVTPRHRKPVVAAPPRFADASSFLPGRP